MRRSRANLFLSALLLLLSTGAGKVEGELSPRGRVRPAQFVSINLLEKSNQNTRKIALAGKARTPGDRFIWQWEIVTPKVGRKVGYNAGMCTALFGGLSNCEWTTFLKKGTVRVSGIVDDSKVKSVLPIVGGTGVFVGARGNMSQYALVSSPESNEYQYLQTFNIFLPEKPVPVSAQ